MTQEHIHFVLVGTKPPPPPPPPQKKKSKKGSLGDDVNATPTKI